MSQPPRSRGRCSSCCRGCCGASAVLVALAAVLVTMVGFDTVQAAVMFYTPSAMAVLFEQAASRAACAAAPPAGNGTAWVLVTSPKAGIVAVTQVTIEAAFAAKLCIRSDLALPITDETLAGAHIASYRQRERRERYDPRCAVIDCGDPTPPPGDFYKALYAPGLRPQRAHRVIHVVRDPLDQIASVYQYYEQGGEHAVQTYRTGVPGGNRTVRAHLAALPLADGIRFLLDLAGPELGGYPYWRPQIEAAAAMYEEVESLPHAMNIRFEELKTGYNGFWDKVFSHWEVPAAVREQLSAVARSKDLALLSPAELAANKHVTSKGAAKARRAAVVAAAKGDPEIWRLVSVWRRRMGYATE